MCYTQLIIEGVAMRKLINLEVEKVSDSTYIVFVFDDGTSPTLCLERGMSIAEILIVCVKALGVELRYSEIREMEDERNA
jgi:hypothetical protein